MIDAGGIIVLVLWSFFSVAPSSIFSLSSFPLSKKTLNKLIKTLTRRGLWHPWAKEDDRFFFHYNRYDGEPCASCVYISTRATFLVGRVPQIYDLNRIRGM